MFKSSIKKFVDFVIQLESLAQKLSISSGPVPGDIGVR